MFLKYSPHLWHFFCPSQNGRCRARTLNQWRQDGHCSRPPVHILRRIFQQLFGKCSNLKLKDRAHHLTLGQGRQLSQNGISKRPVRIYSFLFDCWPALWCKQNLVVPMGNPRPSTGCCSPFRVRQVKEAAWAGLEVRRQHWPETRGSLRWTSALKRWATEATLNARVYIKYHNGICGTVLVL